MHEMMTTLMREAPVLTDGAWGTELQQRGLKPGESPEALNLFDSEAVEATARSYVEAGSRVIITNSFGGNRFVLERHGLADRLEEINRSAAEISKRAAGTEARVFASIGPTGKMLMMGEVTEEELREAFAEQARALAAGGADGLVVETMSDLEEAKLALEGCKTTGLPTVVCMVYDAGAEDDRRTMMGISPPDATRELEAAGADAIGSNCGQGIEGFVAICKAIRANTALPIWIKANAGLPEMVDGRTVYRSTPESFAAVVPNLLEAGANFIGGCCGTSPAFIRAMKPILPGS